MTADGIRTPAGPVELYHDRLARSPSDTGAPVVPFAVVLASGLATADAPGDAANDRVMATAPTAEPFNYRGLLGRGASANPARPVPSAIAIADDAAPESSATDAVPPLPTAASAPGRRGAGPPAPAVARSVPGPLPGSPENAARPFRSAVPSSMIDAPQSLALSSPEALDPPTPAMSARSTPASAVRLLQSPGATSMVVVALQEVAEGLRLFVRIQGMTPADRERLRSEATALLARHGMRLDGVVVETGFAESQGARRDETRRI